MEYAENHTLHHYLIEFKHKFNIDLDESNIKNYNNNNNNNNSSNCDNNTNCNSSNDFENIVIKEKNDDNAADKINNKITYLDENLIWRFLIEIALGIFRLFFFF
jgi:hypothetical protein